MTTNRSVNQEKLFEIAPQFKVTSIGACRVAFGAAAEIIACKVFGLDRIAINGQFEVNFDAERDGVFYEIKSVRESSGKIVCYDWRMKKEEGFPDLVYVIVIHRISGVTENIVERMAASCRILLCSGSLIRELSKGLTKNVHKIKEGSERYRYNRKGYIDGYRNLPVKSILSHVRIRLGIAVDFYGVSRTIPVLIA